MQISNVVEANEAIHLYSNVYDVAFLRRPMIG